MKMEIIGPLLLSLFSGLSTLLGVAPIYFKIKNIENIISLCLSLSFFMLLSISFFDLIPSSFKLFYNDINGILIGIIFFIVGYIIIIIMNKKSNNSNLYNIGIISLISIILHNIPEGMIVFINSNNNIKLGIKTFLAIFFHNIPEGMLISIPLYYSKESRDRVLFKVILASISEPIGAIISYILMNNKENNYLIIKYLPMFVSGLMISLCINDIYKELLKYKNKYIIYGFIISLLFIIFIII